MEATDLAAYRLPPLKPPIFILGNPRSGTTMLRLMLTCHREIVVPPECGFAVWFYDAYRDWNPSRTAAFVDDLMGARKFCTWGVSRDELTDFFARRLPTSYAEAAALVYECYGRCRGRRFSRWGDKNNFHIDHIDTLDELFPRSFFVHIVRDGRSVACSYQQMHAEAFESRFAPQLPSKIADVAAEWRGNNEKIDAGLAALGPGRSHRLRFEDLVCDRPTGPVRCTRRGFRPEDARILAFQCEPRARARRAHVVEEENAAAADPVGG